MWGSKVHIPYGIRRRFGTYLCRITMFYVEMYFYRFRKGFSLSQAMDMLNEDNDLLQNVDEIFVEPPDPNVDTDEDSADEDEGGMIYNLSGNVVEK